MTTYIKPIGCPDFIAGMCPICGIIVGGSGGMVRHPAASGCGVNEALAHIGNEYETKRVSKKNEVVRDDERL